MTEQPLPPAAETPAESGKRRFSLGMALAWALVLGLLLAIGLMLRRTQQGPIRIGDPVPEDLTLRAFDGTTYRLGDLKGTVVLINFWASWCVSCKDEAEALQAAWAQLADRGDVLFLGVDYVDTEPEALRWIEHYGITYPNGPDLRTRWAQAFRIKGVPETYIVDKQGRLAYVKIGPFQGLAEILNAITPLLEP